ncbi:hypothetical protein COU61_00310 [Candidatus Pacearchaeota archaeon CG10_big_fil_rev_8_21_14_0_10_35_13]|nr:MAG: hypothetical protein COU61_00310 [Candidatus Pacearchaeota archaeon CG10_big_fil_rev_8_21_14_0_10_35_13]
MPLKQFLKNLKLNVFYQPILGVSLIILVLSLFIPVVGASQTKIQLSSLVAVIYSILAWFSDDFVGTIQQNVNQRREQYDDKFWMRGLIRYFLIHLTLVLLFLASLTWILVS